MRIAGLDPSATCIGYADPDGTLHSLRPDHGVKGGRRLSQLAALVEGVIRHYPPRPDLVIIEGYSLGSPHRHTLFTLGEVGGVIRCRLFELDIPYTVVPPASLKRFATGAGNADKERMLETARRCGATPRNHDEADAYHARRMGRCAHGIEAMTADHELDAVAALTW